MSGWISVFGKYTASCGNRVKCSDNSLHIHLRPEASVCNKRSHLVNKRTGTTGADTVHTLLYIAAFKINDLSIFSAKLDRNIGLRCVIL